LYEITYELLHMDPTIYDMTMIIPLLRRHAYESSPHQASIKVIFQKHGRNLQNQTNTDRLMQMNINAGDGAKAILMIPSSSKTNHLRKKIYENWGYKPENVDVDLIMNDRILHDYEPLIGLGCLPTAINEIHIYNIYINTISGKQ